MFIFEGCWRSSLLSRASIAAALLGTHMASRQACFCLRRQDAVSLVSASQCKRRSSVPLVVSRFSMSAISHQLPFKVSSERTVCGALRCIHAKTTEHVRCGAASIKFRILCAYLESRKTLRNGGVPRRK